VLDYLTELETYLLGSPILIAYNPLVVGGGGHGGKFAIVLDGGVVLFVKPATGVGDGGRATLNEAAAWDVACLLGWSHLIGCTVLRPLRLPTSGTLDVAACQVLWPGDFCPPLDVFEDDEIWQAAVFDFLIQHTDRGSNNWFGVPPATVTALGGNPRQQLKLIDHGNAFDPAGGVVSSSFYAQKAGLALPTPALDAVERFLEQHHGSRLRDRLGADAYRAVITRAETLFGTRKLP
jgi:hypothetical protein